ncbi:molybdopterin-dependent oxidoreductase [Deinococcus deserti]
MVALLVGSGWSDASARSDFIRVVASTGEPAVTPRVARSDRRARTLPAPLAGYRYLRAAGPRPAAAASQRVLLTVETKTGKKQTYTLAQLRALPAMRYTTFHPQLRQRFTYEGVPLRDLATAGGFVGRDLQVYAENGYVTTIAARDYQKEAVMLAYAANGKEIPVLQKGPLTVVMPPDEKRFPAQKYDYAWVWFVDRITPAK